MFKQIILGTDGSTDALKAAELCRDLLDLNPEATLTIIHAQAPFAGSIENDLWHGPVDISLVNQALAEAGKHSIAVTMRLFAGYEERVEACIEPGDAARVISERAKDKGADLVVVGSRGLSGVSSLLMGSVSTKLVQIAPCSVLVARH